jgi:hypothetical protein
VILFTTSASLLCASVSVFLLGILPPLRRSRGSAALIYCLLKPSLYAAEQCPRGPLLSVLCFALHNSSCLGAHSFEHATISKRDCERSILQIFSFYGFRREFYFLFCRSCAMRACTVTIFVCFGKGDAPLLPLP